MAKKKITTEEMIRSLDEAIIKYGAKIPDERLAEIERDRREAREKRKHQ